MYWGESGETPCIYRAGLDGSGRQCISTQYVEHPSGMTLGMHCPCHICTVTVHSWCDDLLQFGL